MASRWASVAVCFVALLLLVVLIDGWAVEFLPRLVEKLVLSVAFVILFALAVLALMGRDRAVFFSQEDARRLDDPQP